MKKLLNQQNQAPHPHFIAFGHVNPSRSSSSYVLYRMQAVLPNISDYLHRLPRHPHHPTMTIKALTSFVGELPANFVSIHKSYLINKDHIDYVEGAMMVMKNGQMLPVGKNFRKVVREWLG